MSASAPIFARYACHGLLASLLLGLASRPLLAQQEEPAPAPAAQPQDTPPGGEAPVQAGEALPGIAGPALADLGTIAEVQVPEGCHFLGAEDSRRFLEANGNISSQRELGTVRGPQQSWFVVFEYSDEGHIKDDDKDELDADEIWKVHKSGNEVANEERKRRGWPPLNLVGWATKPHYDETTRNLEWAIRAESEGGPIVNHNTRILGRTGVMEVTLVCDPADFEIVLLDYKKLLGGFGYKSGQRYAEYRAGDKLAKYGLTALVAGGAGVWAAKTGLFGKIWKFLVAALIGLGALAKRLFGRKPKPTESI